MKVKDLIKILKTQPKNMEIVVNSGITPDETTQGYIAVPVQKAKTKLVKKGIVQSRPHRDDDATLMLVLE